MTPSEQLAKRILAGGLPMLADYVAEVTLRLDEMAADKPEPPTALTEPRCACGHVQSQHKNTRGYCYQLCPDGSRCQCSSFHALTALTELRTIPGAAGANADARVTCAADILGDGAFFCSLPSGHEGRHEVYAPHAEWEARRNRIVGEVARYRLALQAANHDLRTTRFQLEEARAELAKEREQANQWLADKHDLEQELAGVRGCAATATARCDDAERDNTELESRLAEVDAELAKVTAERDALTVRVAELEARLHQHEGKVK